MSGAACGFDGGGGVVGGAAVAVADDGGSSLGERDGDGGTETGGRAGDEGYLVVETEEVDDVLHTSPMYRMVLRLKGHSQIGADIQIGGTQEVGWWRRGGAVGCLHRLNVGLKSHVDSRKTLENDGILQRIGL